MGWQAHDLLFNTLAEIKKDSDITVDIFAYDLDEPDFATKLLELAAVGRIRMILDNSSSHVSSNGKVSPEDVFEEKFRSTATANAGIVRGRYRRQAHQKTFIIKRNNNPFRVLTALPILLNGLYINANHVIVIENKPLRQYQQVLMNPLPFFQTRLNQNYKLTSQDLLKISIP
jgi:hypothetical protein